jgi:N-acetyl sugar amidotransferase
MIKNYLVKYCNNCLSMSTRPRIKFNDINICNACKWSETKKKIDWNLREDELIKLLTKHKNRKNIYDCIVPVSGGKDGSYVAWNIKNKYNMNPLCVTVNPHLQTYIGKRNIKNFAKSGFNLISVDPDYKSMQKLNKIGFFEMGMGYYGWLLSIFSAVIRIATVFKIDLVFYAEDGEIEYGGSNENEKNYIFNVDYIKKIYIEGGYQKILNMANLSENNKFYFTFPESDQTQNLELTHWSYFENWDPYRNYLLAKDKCGLDEEEKNNIGTFTNFAQNDQKLCSLHYYLMYLKFGFGRANQDASIEIRRGAMSRDQAINLVKLYDGIYPVEHINEFLDYFEISKIDFDNNLDKWANKELFVKNNDGIWLPKFEVGTL